MFFYGMLYFKIIEVEVISMEQSLETALILAIAAGVINAIVKGVEIWLVNKTEKKKMKLKVTLERNSTLENNIQDFFFGVDSVMKNVTGFPSDSIRHIDKEISTDLYRTTITNQMVCINEGMESTFRTITTIKLLIPETAYTGELIQSLEECRENLEVAVTKVMEYDVYKTDRDFMESLDREVGEIREIIQKNVDGSISLLNKYFNEDPF